jgi:hypothetical protein
MQQLAPCVLVKHPEYYDNNSGGKSVKREARLNAHGFWTMPRRAVQKKGTPHHYDLTLAEMRQYADGKMVLAMAPQHTQQGRAQYPVDVDMSLLTRGATQRNFAHSRVVQVMSVHGNDRIRTALASASARASSDRSVTNLTAMSRS